MVKPSASNPLDSLVDLACRDGVDIRPTLLRVVTDLYVQKPNHGAEEVTQFVELALGLIEVVDAQTRSVITATLGELPERSGGRSQKARRDGYDRRGSAH